MSRLSIISAAVCSAIAVATPVAHAHQQGNWSYGAAVKSTSSFHQTSAKAQQTGFRPDDRSGLRGI